MNARASWDWLHAPMSTYEVHLGSWKRHPDGRFYSYHELAEHLVPYVKDMGFTHVELLPVTEHPLDESWGYQTTGYFAATTRFGEPDGLRALIDAFHRAGIGVILDWVPAHFPTDAFALARFDGTALYEHADPRRGMHQDWGTHIFNYGRNEVRSFLLSSAHYWLEEFHADGLRVDAVASMLYLDYSRKAGEWLPNKYGGRENIEAIEFLRELNVMVHEEFPGALTCAEESTSWPMVSRPTYVGGLGFSMKWNMGWMNDTLSYIRLDPVYRRFNHNQLTFGQLYAYTENFLLPLSHDEVVHGKGALLDKMPGDTWQEFANLRLLFTYQYTSPGKKLNFMGNELAQGREWKSGFELEWGLLAVHWHNGVQHMLRDLNRLHREVLALHEQDFVSEGFDWIDCHDADQSTLSFIRRARDGSSVVVVLNFTPVPRYNYRIGLPSGGRLERDLQQRFRVLQRVQRREPRGGSRCAALDGFPVLRRSHVATPGRHHPGTRARMSAAPRLTVLFVTSEVAPLIKTGGLADVAGSLPAALMHAGVDVRVLVPGYKQVMEAVKSKGRLTSFPALGEMPASQLLAGKLPSGVPLMIVDSPRLYDRPGGPYQDASGSDWPDNAVRFGLLSYLGRGARRSRVADQLAPSHPPLQRLADRAGAGLSALHARRQSAHGDDHPQPRLSGRVPAHHREPARAAAFVVRSGGSRVLRQHVVPQGRVVLRGSHHHRQPQLRARDPARTARHGDAGFAGAPRGRAHRHPQWHRHRRLGSRDRSLHSALLQRGALAGQAGEQACPAAAPRAGSRRQDSAAGDDRALHAAEGTGSVARDRAGSAPPACATRGARARAMRLCRRPFWRSPGRMRGASPCTWVTTRGWPTRSRRGPTSSSCRRASSPAA